MKHRDILKIVNKLCKKLDKFGSQLVKSFEEEEVHVFRVTYKRLRAFLFMLRSCYCSDQPKIPRKLKEYYHLTGELRDLQLVNNKLLSEHGSAIQELCVLKIRLYITAKKELILSFDLHDMIDEARLKFAKQIPAKLGITSIYMFRDERWDQVRSYAINPSNDERIHSVRKLLKILYYIDAILKKVDDPSYTNEDWQSYGEDFFIQLMKELGDYNDTCIAIRLLALIEGYIENQQLGYLEKLKLKWNNERDKQRLLLMHKLKTQIFPGYVLSPGLMEI